MTQYADGTFPKYLVEIDWRAFARAPFIPTRALWVARLRKPFALGLIEVAAESAETPLPNQTPMPIVRLWPAVLDADLRARAKLANRLTRQLFYEHDLDPHQWPAPRDNGMAGDPPAFIHAVKPNSNREYLLDAHAPRLWHVRIHADGAEGLTWIAGFGIPPEFPRDVRRVANWFADKCSSDTSTAL